MSDTANIPDAPATADDLDQRVQALVEEIELATARIERAVTDDVGEQSEGPTPDPGAALEEAPARELEPIERRAAGMAPQAHPVEARPAAQEPAPEPAAPSQEPAPGPLQSPAPPSPQPPETLEALDAGLEADLDRLLAVEAAEAGPPTDQSEPVASDPELESELDELLRQGEISAPQIEQSETNTRSRLDRQLSKLRDEDLEGGPEPTPPASEEPEPAPATPAPAPTPPVVASEPAPPKRSLLAAALIEAADFTRRAAPKVAARAEPVAYRAAAAMNRPLEQRGGGRAKRIVGWLAIYTAILAACVWVYVLFLRPASPESSADGPRIVGVEERGE